MVFKKIYFGFKNIFIFNKCLNHSAKKEYEKAFALSEKFNFRYSNINTYILMVLYKGYAALVTDRYLHAEESFNFFLDHIDSVSQCNADEKKYLKVYAARSYLLMEDLLKDKIELREKLNKVSLEYDFSFIRVSTRIRRTFIYF